MQNYLPHLLAGIAAAHCEQGLIDCRIPGIPPRYSLHNYCGLTTAQFPPPEQWTEAQLEEINLAFRLMMFSWNLDIEIPGKVPPPDVVYRLQVSTLERKVHVGVPGTYLLGFCVDEPAHCPFGQAYCACRELLSES